MGRKKTTQGYWLVLQHEHPQASNRGYILEHRIVWEEYYNCCLLRKAIVHHKDGNTENNDISNLEAYPSHSPHARLHMLGKQLNKKDMSDRQCKICSSKTTRIAKDGYQKWSKYQDGFICSLCSNRLYKKKRKELISSQR